MLTYNYIFAYASIAIALASYTPYLIGTLKGKIIPHTFSWLTWSLLVGITYAAQVVKGGGTGSWVTGLTSFICFGTFLLSLVKGTKKFVIFDWVSLGAACLALILWVLTNDPTASVVLVTLADAFGFLPTLRKGYLKPHEDSPLMWGLTSLKWLLSVFALQSFSIATLFYPTYLIVVNSLFTILLIVRQAQNKKNV